MCWGTLGEDQDGSGSRPKFWEVLVNVPEIQYGSGNIPEVRDGSGEPRGGPDGSETLGEVHDGLEDPRGGPGRDVEHPGSPGREGGPSEWSGMGRGTLGEVRDG